MRGSVACTHSRSCGCVKGPFIGYRRACPVCGWFLVIRCNLLAISATESPMQIGSEIEGSVLIAQARLLRFFTKPVNYVRCVFNELYSRQRGVLPEIAYLRTRNNRRPFVGSHLDGPRSPPEEVRHKRRLSARGITNLRLKSRYLKL